MKVTVVRLLDIGLTSLCHWDIKSIQELETKNKDHGKHEGLTNGKTNYSRRIIGAQVWW